MTNMNLENIEKDREYMLMFTGTLQDFYELDEQKAEFLSEGIIVMHSPASLIHEKIFRDIFFQLHQYVIENQLGEVLGSRFTIRLGNFRFEPDIVFIANDNHGHFTEYEFIGTPNLIIEIVSKTTRHHDLMTKRNLFREYEVPEIWFVDHLKNEIQLDVLEKDGYQTFHYRLDDVIPSRLLIGFEIKLSDYSSI